MDSRNTNEVNNQDRASSIQLDAVSKQFPKEAYLAVDHVTFQVNAGELVVILGPSGCGKTTLLKMINRLYEPTSGQILVSGVDVQNIPATQLRREIGYVIQQVGLFPHMTIGQNIAIVPKLLGWEKARIESRVAELLNMVNLPESYRIKKPRQLSGGEQSRVGLARALAANPQILLMDEPFAAVDAITRRHLQYALIGIQRRLHKTILFVTHDVEEALTLADKIAIMNKGKLVQYGQPLQILNHPANDFVEELVQGGSVLRRMSVITVETVLSTKSDVSDSSRGAAEGGNEPLIGVDDDLRMALSQLLESSAGGLTVVNHEGVPVGRLTFDDLRKYLREGETETEEPIG